jgi:hypothetical protein
LPRLAFPVFFLFPKNTKANKVVSRIGKLLGKTLELNLGNENKVITVLGEELGKNRGKVEKRIEKIEETLKRKMGKSGWG